MSIIIIACFACIQIIEVLSYCSRLSGVLIEKRSMAYTLQNAVFMLTRFFMLALMPVLGLLIDQGMDKTDYLIMCIWSVVLSSITCLFIILFFRNRVISAFIDIIDNVSSGRALLFSLMKFPIYFCQSPKYLVEIPRVPYLLSSNIFWLSSIVFFSYAISVFFVFFLGLSFSEYRVTLSQTSGVINAFSTILLTFWIEPKLSLTIDKEIVNYQESSNMILSLLLGRILGVGLYSCLFFIALYFVVNY